MKAPDRERAVVYAFGAILSAIVAGVLLLGSARPILVYVWAGIAAAFAVAAAAWWWMPPS